MTKRMKDTDYLAISSRVKVLETRLLTPEQMDQVLEARSDDEAAKLLQEHGYPELDTAHPEKLDAALSAVRQETLADLEAGLPDSRYLDIFKVKYDYHNAKSILKARAMNLSAEHMLMDMGRIAAEDLKAAMESGDTGKLPGLLSSAVREAGEVLDSTRDPQLSDMVLDRWYYQDLTAVAAEIGSKFLQGYIWIQIDAANLRVAVRTLRMGKGSDFLKSALFPGGSIPEDSLFRAVESGDAGLEALYRTTALKSAAARGAEALSGGALTDFEKLCDDAVSLYLAEAKYVPFGEAPVLGYLVARETEYINLRILLMGRNTGLPAEVIRSRLRSSCV